MTREELTNEALGMLLEWAKRADAFASEQVPAVAQEIVAYGRAYETTIVAVAAIAFLSWLSVSLWALKTSSELAWEDGPCAETMGRVAWWALGLIIVPVTLCGVANHLPLMIQAWFAPRLYVIQYVSDLLK